MPYDPYTGMPVPGPAWGPRPPAPPMGQEYQTAPQSQQYSNVQPTQQPVQMTQSFISGRMVQNIAEVVPQEVPMNGSIAVFPLQDLSAVFAKAWNQNGTITTVKYVPEQLAEPEPTPDPFQQQIFQRLDAIEKALSQTTSVTDSKANKNSNAAKNNQNKDGEAK